MKVFAHDSVANAPQLLPTFVNESEDGFATGPPATGACVGVGVGIGVGVGTIVGTTVGVGVGVAPEVGVTIGVGVGVAMGDAADGFGAGTAVTLAVPPGPLHWTNATDATANKLAQNRYRTRVNTRSTHCSPREQALLQRARDYRNAANVMRKAPQRALQKRARFDDTCRNQMRTWGETLPSAR